MIIHDWAKRWGIKPYAIADLLRLLGTEGVSANGGAEVPESEATVSCRVRLEASQKGCRLWRNNVGAVQLPTGGMMRFGLANDSHQLNKVIKSSDLVGIRPVTILPEHVGRMLGQFICREVKRQGWHYTETDREKAQLAFITLVQSMGGDARFCDGEGTI